VQRAQNRYEKEKSQELQKEPDDDSGEDSDENAKE
jgi:hypothetical protein